jgi:hypothetical protein
MGALSVPALDDDQKGRPDFCSGAEGSVSPTGSSSSTGLRRPAGAWVDDSHSPADGRGGEVECRSSVDCGLASGSVARRDGVRSQEVGSMLGRP